MPASAASQAATPTAFPESGTFAVTQRVTLTTTTPGATIHYTTDGSAPTSASPVFDPFVRPVLEAGDAAGASRYTARALAAKAGAGAQRSRDVLVRH